MQTPTVTRPRVVEGLRLVTLVGRGGEGEVWEARDPAGRRRALKLVRPAMLADDAEQRVAHLLAIAHPALVRVHRGGVLGDGLLAGWGWLEMDFVDGEPLHEAPPDPDVLDRLWPLAEALDALHDGDWSAGVPMVHRDVKPANLIGTPDGRLVLVDPSTLRGVDATHLTRIGTPVFCAPEVAGGRIGPAADVYSFAATAVALMTGARGPVLAELLDDVADLGLPPGVRRALSHRPSERPKTCAAVLDATVRFADEGGWDTLVLPQPAAHTPLDDTLVDRDPPVQPEGAPELGGAGPLPWAWTAALLVVLVAAAVALGGALPPQEAAVLGLAALAGHFVAQTFARTSLLLTLLLAPAAWAFALAARIDARPRRQAWVRGQLLGALGVVTGGLVLLSVGEGPGGALVAGGVLATVLGVAVHRWHGLLGACGRLLLAPLWLVGSVLVAVGCVVLIPVAVLTGEGRHLGRLLGWTLASAVEPFRGP